MPARRRPILAQLFGIERCPHHARSGVAGGLEAANPAVLNGFVVGSVRRWFAELDGATVPSRPRDVVQSRLVRQELRARARHAAGHLGVQVEPRAKLHAMLSTITLAVVRRLQPTSTVVTTKEIITVAAVLWLDDVQLVQVHPEWCANLEARRRSSGTTDHGSTARQLRGRLRSSGWRIDYGVREVALAGSPPRS